MANKMMRKVKKLRAKTVVFYILMLALVAFTTLPLIFMVEGSIKPLDEQFIFPPRFYVSNPTLSNFTNLFRNMDSSVVPFSRYIFNSLITSTATVFLTVIVCCMAAYALAKIKVRGSNFIFSIIIAALMFAPQVTQIPTFLIVKNLHILNTYWALIIPKIAVAYNLFLLKQFADQIPDPFLEAARMDGASELTLFWKIVMPMLKPAWATVVVFSFVANWNDYFSPLIFIQNQQLKTLPLALQLIGQSGNIATAGEMAAATFCMTMPTILIFVIMQSRVVKTMAYSGIKA